MLFNVPLIINFIVNNNYVHNHDDKKKMNSSYNSLASMLYTVHSAVVNNHRNTDMKT